MLLFTLINENSTVVIFFARITNIYVKKTVAFVTVLDIYKCFLQWTVCWCS